MTRNLKLKVSKFFYLANINDTEFPFFEEAIFFVQWGRQETLKTVFHFGGPQTYHSNDAYIWFRKQDICH